MDKLTKNDIINVTNYILDNFCYAGNRFNEMHILHNNFVNVLEHLSLYFRANKFIIANIVILMEKLNNLGEYKYLLFGNILFYFAICFLIIDRFYNDHHFSSKTVCDYFQFNVNLGNDSMFEILALIDFNVNISKNDIQRIYQLIF
jgi:hypothetical protein